MTIRTWLLRAAGAVLVGSVAVYSALATREAFAPLDAGFTVDDCSTPERCTVSAVRAPGAAAALERGDLLRQVDGNDAFIEVVSSGATAFFSSTAGVPETVTFLRRGDLRSTVVVPRRTRFTPTPGLGLVWMSKWLAIAVGAVLIFSRLRSPVAWLAGLMLLCAALGERYPILQQGVGGSARSLAGPIGGAVVLQAASTAHAAGGLSFPMLWLMFPSWLPFIRRRRLALFLSCLPWLPFAIAEVILTWNAWFHAGVPAPIPIGLTTVAAAAVVAIGTTALLVNYRVAARADARIRLRAIVHTLVVVGVLWILGAVASISGSARFVRATDLGLEISIVILPVVVGWAVLRHRVFGMRVYFRRAVRYAFSRFTLLTLVIVPAVVLAWFAGRHGAASVIERPWPLALFGMATALAIVRAPLVDWIDRHLFLDESGAQRILLALAKRLRGAHDLEAVAGALRAVVDESYRPRRLHVVLAPDEDAARDAIGRQLRELGIAIPPALDRRAPTSVQVSGTDPDAPFGEEEIWLTPILSQDDQLRGAIVAGERASGEPYDEDDLALLSAMAHAAAVQAEAVELADAVIAERTARTAMAERFSRDRDRLTRELHDGLGATLARIALVADSGEPDSSDNAGALARSGIKELRQMLWATDQSAMDWTDTAAYLRRLALETAEAAKLRVRTELNDTLSDSTTRVDVGDALSEPLTARVEVGDPLSEPLIAPVEVVPPAVRLALLRALQQSVANVVAHARATDVRVALTRTPGSVRLLVEDNGCGFDPASAPGRRGGHYGLESLAARAAELGGRFTIDSAPGKGTRVLFEIPIGEG